MIEFIKKLWCRKEESNLRPTHYECPTGGGQSVKSRVYADQKGLYRPGTVTIWPQQEYPVWRRTINCLALFFVMILAGCGESATNQQTEATEIEKCPTGYYGDSIGWQVEHSDHAPPFDYYNEPGIPIIGFKVNGKRVPIVIDKSYCRVYIALGTNQASDIQATVAALLVMLEGIEDKVICVLPMTKRGILVEPERTILRTYCPRWIDPIQHGVYPLSVDQIHLSQTDGGENIKRYVEFLLNAVPVRDSVK